MRLLKITVIFIFICSLLLTGYSKYVERSRQDSTRPTITSELEELTLSVSYQPEELYAGLTARDEKDGDLTNQIIAGDFSPFTEPGVCRVKYVVFDSSNQPAELTRRVRFTDYESPKLTLSQPLVFAPKSYEELLKYVGAQDCLDGNLSAHLKNGESTVSFSTPGDYTYEVEVTNSFGDRERQLLPVHIVEKEQQSLQIILTTPLIYITKGDRFDPVSFVTEIKNASGQTISKELLEVDSTVNRNKAGLGEVHYTVTDEDGRTGETWLTVIVREKQK